MSIWELSTEWKMSMNSMKHIARDNLGRYSKIVQKSSSLTWRKKVSDHFCCAWWTGHLRHLPGAAPPECVAPCLSPTYPEGKDGAPMLLSAISLLSPWRSTWPWTVPMRFSCCYARPESSRLCHLGHNAGKNLRPQPALVWTLWSKLFPRSGPHKMRQRSRGLAVDSCRA